jgi:hypothetical protein
MLIALAASLQSASAAQITPTPLKLAADSFTQHVLLMRAMPSVDAVQGVRTGLTLLSRAIDEVPTRRTVAVGQASRIIAMDAENLGQGNVEEPVSAQSAKHGLEAAAGVLILLAAGPYRNVTGLNEAVDELRTATAAIDANRPLGDQRSLVLDALAAAARPLQLLASAAPRSATE